MKNREKFAIRTCRRSFVLSELEGILIPDLRLDSAGWKLEARSRKGARMRDEKSPSVRD